MGAFMRELKNRDYDGRNLDGRAFGQGFDSPQVHLKILHSRIFYCLGSHYLRYIVIHTL